MTRMIPLLLPAVLLWTACGRTDGPSASSDLPYDATPIVHTDADDVTPPLTDLWVAPDPAPDGVVPGDLPPHDVAADASDMDSIAEIFDAPVNLDLPPASDLPDVPVCTPGQVRGLACAPNQTTAVSFATVTLEVTSDCTGGVPVVMTTTSDALGYYLFVDVPPGGIRLSFDKGAFHGSGALNLAPGEFAELTSAGKGTQCFEADRTRIAVVAGSADHIEDLLEELELDYDLYPDGTSSINTLTSAAHGLLVDPVKMQEYDIIFFNCTSRIQAMVEGTPQMAGNLQAFVAAGGSVYASDWAWPYVEWPWPNAIDFAGQDQSFVKAYYPKETAGPRQGPGPSETEMQSGVPPLQLTATILDVDLALALGKTQITVYFDLGTWVVANAAGLGTTTHAQTAVIDGPDDWGTRPLVLSFRPAPTSGHVIFTSFHNIAQQDAGGSVEDIKAILTYLVFSL